MAVRWVPAAVVRPHRCAFIPFLGSHHPRGFFDFGTEIMAFDGHAYCSVVAAEQMAAAMGWAPVGDKLAAEAKVTDRDARIAELEAEVADRDETIAAFGVLKRAKAIQEPRGPGRPRKNPEEVAA